MERPCKGILYEDVLRRSCQAIFKTPCTRFCQETSHRDLVQGSCIEISNSDLAKGSCRDLVQRSCIEISHTDVASGSPIQPLYRDLAKSIFFIEAFHRHLAKRSL